ncbi:hypothetical protein K8T06_06275 [bacterium]|nr:hypothetical protein [bacterium]
MSDKQDEHRKKIISSPPSLHQPSDIRLHELFRDCDWDNQTPAMKTICKRHGVAVWEGPAVLVKMITRDGSNTLVSTLMGDSENSYLNITRAVAQKMKVAFDEKDSEIDIERKCLESVLRRYLQTAPETERQEIMAIIVSTGKELHVEELKRQFRDNSLRLGTLSLLVRKIGARATADVVKRVVAGIISRSAAREASKRAAQIAGYAIPLLNAVMIGWTVWDLAGPAYRKIIPTVLEIAILRMDPSPHLSP